MIRRSFERLNFRLDHEYEADEIALRPAFVPPRLPYSRGAADGENAAGQPSKAHPSCDRRLG